jgi:hypothetical protein
MTPAKPSADFSLGQVLTDSLGLYWRNLFRYAFVLIVNQILAFGVVILILLGALLLLSIKAPTDLQAALQTGEEVALSGEASAAMAAGCPNRRCCRCPGFGHYWRDNRCDRHSAGEAAVNCRDCTGDAVWSACLGDRAAARRLFHGRDDRALLRSERAGEYPICEPSGARRAGGDGSHGARCA